MKAGNFKEVKSGGRVAQKSAGTAPSGRPNAQSGGASRGEFAVQTAGTVASGLGSRAEYAQESAGRK